MSNLSDFMGGGASIVRRQLFTANGTWTKPEGLIGGQCWITAIGGGGSGAGTSYNSEGAGGGSGFFVERFPVDVSGTSSETVTIGAGAAGGINNGLSGATTSFGSIVSVIGGEGGRDGPTRKGALGGRDGGSSGGSGIPAFPGKGDTGGMNFSIFGGGGGGGLVLDDSGVMAGESRVNSALGGTGYGAGSGAGDSDVTDTSYPGASGAVLIEWLEKA